MKYSIPLLLLCFISHFLSAQCTECPSGATLITGSTDINEQNNPGDYCISGTWTGQIANIADNSTITICPTATWEMPGSYTFQKSVVFTNYGDITDNGNGYNLKIQGQTTLSNEAGASITVLGFENQDADFVNAGEITAESIYLHGISSNTGTLNATGSCGGTATFTCGFYLGNKSDDFDNSGTINAIDAILKDGIVGGGAFNVTGILSIENNGGDTDNNFFVNTLILQSSQNVSLGNFEISGVLFCNNANLTAEACFTATGSFGSSCSGSSDPIIACPSAALPVKIVDFAVREIENTLVLNWEVESEINVERYVVHYSTDGIHFETLSETRATNDRYYQATTNILSGETLYFRLQNIDFDGQSDFYENTIAISKSTEISYQIMPNPAIRGENLTVKFDSEQDALISIYNINGQKLSSRFFKDQDYVKFDLGSIEHSGLYIVKISTATNNYTEEVFIR